MNSWGSSREVEKPMMFAERALKVALRLGVLQEAVATMFGGNHELVNRMRDARLLLEEAAARGVKGKEPS